MRGMSTIIHARREAVGEDGRVTAIELLFDLVLVFAVTQVTGLMAEDPTPLGVLRGLLVLALLWWVWVGYSWLGNWVRADEGIGRVAMFGAMGAIFVLAVAIPEAFDDLDGGLDGPLVLVVAYLAARLLHLAIFLLTSGEDVGLRRQLLRFAPALVGATALLAVATRLEGTAQMAVWAAALAVDCGGTILSGVRGWRLNAAGAFAERHGLVVIIALGESIVAIGVGVSELPVSWPIVVASLLGLAVIACLWWAYFDVVALVAERVLRRLEGAERARMARDSYSFLHLPMVAGIVLYALGLEEVLAHVGDTAHHDLADPLPLLHASALYGGVGLYLLGHVAFRLRNIGTLNRQRVGVLVALLALIPLAVRLPALAALALLALVLVALIAYEAVRYAEVRNRVRHEGDVLVSGER